MALRLNSQLDLAAHAEAFDQQSYAAINDILVPKEAQRLFRAISSYQDWNLVARIEGQHRDFKSREMDQLDDARRIPFQNLVTEEAQKTGFQYLYDQMPLFAKGKTGALDHTVLKEAFGFVRSQAFLNLGRQVTGVREIGFADCMVSRYRPGHYLTEHDDDTDDKDRVAAYVLNLTPDWRADYGGLLCMIDKSGDVTRALTPRFNRLCMFKVPQPHSVSAVSPIAPGPRYAITGWFRRGEEPADQVETAA